MNLVLILLLIAIIAGILIWLCYKNCKSNKEKSASLSSLNQTNPNNMVILLKLNSEINREIFKNLLNGITNLEPNSVVIFEFNDFSVGFKANNNGEMYFNSNKDAFPLNCLNNVDLTIFVSPNSLNTAKLLLTPTTDVCDMGIISMRPFLQIIDMPIVSLTNENRILRIVRDDFGTSVGLLTVE
jgi:hypothetical protein